MGRPKLGEEAEVRRRVLDLLPPDGSWIRWFNIEAEARRRRISLGTVRRHLEMAIKEGLVERRVDVEARPPAVYYRRKPLPANLGPRTGISIENRLKCSALWVALLFLGNLSLYLTNEEFREHMNRFAVYGGLTSYVGEFQEWARNVKSDKLKLEEVLNTIPKVQQWLKSKIDEMIQ
jgi:hypothetical protein